MDICATSIFKSQNRWPWYRFKLCPLFLALPQIRGNRLSGSQEGEGILFCSDGHHVARARSPPPVWWARNPGLRVARGGRLESQAARTVSPQALLNVPWLTPSSSARPKCVCDEHLRWGCTVSPAAQAHSLEHGGGRSQLIFWRSPEETRAYCPHHLPDSTTVSIKFIKTGEKTPKT